MGFFEDVLDAFDDGFIGAGPGDGGDGDKEEDGFDKFRFRGMRMLFVIYWVSLNCVMGRSRSATDGGHGGWRMGVAGFLEDLLDALGQRFVSPGSGDGGDGDQEEDGFDEFRFHGMRMLFVYCWLSLIGRFASLLLVYPSAPQLCVRP